MKMIPKLKTITPVSNSKNEIGLRVVCTIVRGKNLTKKLFYFSISPAFNPVMACEKS